MSIAKLSRLPMAIAPSEPDMQGWLVYGSDELPVGTVIDFLVQEQTRDVRYLVVQLTDGLEIAIPIGLVSVIDGEGRIVARYLDSHALRKLPAMPPDPLDDGREIQLYATFLPHRLVDYRRPEFLLGGEREFVVSPLPSKPFENKFVPTPEGRQSNRDRFS